MAKPCANLTWTNNSATGVSPQPDDLAIDRIRSIDFTHAHAAQAHVGAGGQIGDKLQDENHMSHSVDGPSPGAGTHSGLDPMRSGAGQGHNLDGNSEGDDLSGDIDATQVDRPSTQYYYSYRVATKRTASQPADVNSLGSSLLYVYDVAEDLGYPNGTPDSVSNYNVSTEPVLHLDANRMYGNDYSYWSSKASIAVGGVGMASDPNGILNGYQGLIRHDKLNVAPIIQHASVAKAGDAGFQKVTSSVQSNKEFDIRWIGPNGAANAGSDVWYTLTDQLLCPNGVTKFFVGKYLTTAAAYGGIATMQGLGPPQSLSSDGIHYITMSTSGYGQNYGTSANLLQYDYAPKGGYINPVGLSSTSDAGAACDYLNVEPWGRSVGPNTAEDTKYIQVFMYRMNNTNARYSDPAGLPIQGQLFCNGVLGYTTPDFGQNATVTEEQSYHSAGIGGGSTVPYSNLGAYGHHNATTSYYRANLAKGDGSGFAEEIIFDTALSEGDCRTVMAYLGNKYGISNQLTQISGLVG